MCFVVDYKLKDMDDIKQGMVYTFITIMSCQKYGKLRHECPNLQLIQ